MLLQLLLLLLLPLLPLLLLLVLLLLLLLLLEHLTSSPCTGASQRGGPRPCAAARALVIEASRQASSHALSL